MAVKKSDLYSSLWASCDELRGGMDASEYKNYILVLLFVKYVSDKYAGQPYAPIHIPAGASFANLSALKGKPNIGDLINKKIVGPLFAANSLADPPDFNDSAKLGRGDEKVKRLTNLVAIFENPNLDFSANHADGDDLLGDAYEYLMRHFATESGKSKGQFYTPAEVSRTIAQIIGIRGARTSAQTTIYDPTCGSGSLLLRVADAARTPVSLYGQEKDATTSGLARMNMILHDQPTAEIEPGNTLTSPAYLDGERLKRFDYVVANPPFSDKRWSTGVRILDDPFERFGFGVPPNKQGDYAYLLHIVASLKSTGTGICVLPHGVLFRSNAEASIREALVRKGYIQAIIGLPANLFYGTGIPACLVVVDKAGADTREGIFMVDASAGFVKDGPKNRLRERDVHKIVDVFARRLEVPKYSRMVPQAEIESNGFNLNLSRYVDSQEAEDIQDIAGHLQGGIPVADIDALANYWNAWPDLRTELFKRNRVGYVDLAVEASKVAEVIQGNKRFQAFLAEMSAHFDSWREDAVVRLKALKPGFHPKELIGELADGFLAHYIGTSLVDPYAMYQHLMDYCAETMLDDAYLISADGWKAEPQRVIETTKKGAVRDKGWKCDLLPKSVVIARYYPAEQEAINQSQQDLEATEAALEVMAEEHGGDGGALALDDTKIGTVRKRLVELLAANEVEESEVLTEYARLLEHAIELKSRLKAAEASLDAAVLAKYPALTEADIKELVVEDKWIKTIDTAAYGEVDKVGHQLQQRIVVLYERYRVTLAALAERTLELNARVVEHLKTMGFSWN